MVEFAEQTCWHFKHGLVAFYDTPWKVWAASIFFVALLPKRELLDLDQQHDMRTGNGLQIDWHVTTDTGARMKFNAIYEYFNDKIDADETTLLIYM